MKSLRGIFTDEFGVGGANAGWMLSYVEGVSQDGRYVIGQAQDEFGCRRSWLADLGPNFFITPIPEPSTYGLIGATALIALVGFRRKRARRPGA